MLEAAVAFVAWLGASLIVLADGRRGLGAGVMVATVGIAGLVVGQAGPLDAAILAVAGAAAAVPGLRSAKGWGLMPAGSTPRLILCVAGGLLALWIAASITSGGGAAFRFAVMCVAGLAGARVLTSDDSAVLLMSTATLALAVGAAAGLAGVSAAPWPYVAAGVVAAGCAWVQPRTPHAA